MPTLCGSTGSFHICAIRRLSGQICEGCTVDGTVEYSVLSPGVCIASGAIVRNAVVMHNALIEEQAVVENAILDMDIIVGPQAHVGRAWRRAPIVGGPTPDQLTVVEKGTHVPARAVIGPEPLCDDWMLATRPQDFTGERVGVT